MSRKFTFKNLGRALVLVGSAFHAGFVVPVAQVLCVLLCLQGMAMEGISSAKVGEHCSAPTAVASAKVECSAPTLTDLMLLSNVAVDWTLDAVPPLTTMAQVRLESLSGKPNIDIPDLSFPSPPPKSTFHG